MNRKVLLISVMVCFISIRFVGAVNAQVADSLILGSAIKEAVNSHPTILQAQEALKMADARIALSKSNYLPTVEGNATFSSIGPVPSVEFAGKSFKMAPQNSYNAGVTVSQLVYDFGRNSNGDAVEEESKNLAGINIEQAKQRIAASVVNSFFTLVYLQNAIAIKEEQLRTLNRHLEFILKKKETGSATEYEVLSTKVRISSIESQKTDIEAAKGIQQSVMNTLLGRDVNAVIVVANNISSQSLGMNLESVYNHALSNRRDLMAIYEKTKIAELRYKFTRSQNNPTLAAFATGGVKNGYTPYLGDPKLNYVVGLSLKVPIFDANKKENNTLLAQSSIVSSRLDEELMRRSISTEIVEARLNIESAEKKVKQIELQLQQAIKALHLAEVSYKSGVITNLDLLDATTSLSESQLNFLKSKVDYTISTYRLKVAMGDNLY